MRRSIPTAVLSLLALLAVGGDAPTVPALLKGRVVVGVASVIDGDTIEIHGIRIRLNGIDAPEARQLCADEHGEAYRCGAAAAFHLDDILRRSSPARCVIVARDRYRRVVAECSLADGTQIAPLMVAEGHALDWPRYSRGRYAAHQDQAKASRTGMWRGTFQPPWEFRRGKGR